YDIEAVCSCGASCHSNIVNKDEDNEHKECLFMEWSTVSRYYVVYVKDSNYLCLFCANFCNDHNSLERKVLNSSSDFRKCSCINEVHRDSKLIYEKITQMLELKKLKFENLTPVQTVNLLTMSNSSFV